MRLMGWAHEHSGFDKCIFGLPNVRHKNTKYMYQILSKGLMGWAHKHSGFDKCKLGLPNVRHRTTK